MRRFFRRGKKEKTVVEKVAPSTCSCELCLLSNELDRNIEDKTLRELMSAFVLRPSDVKNIVPEDKLKEAKKLEEGGDIPGATDSYRRAVTAALAKEGYDIKKYCKSFIDFINKYQIGEKLYCKPESYAELTKRPELVKIIRAAYQKFFKLSAEEK
jgi:hypothetical protein